MSDHDMQVRQAGHLVLAPLLAGFVLAASAAEAAPGSGPQGRGAAAAAGAAAGRGAAGHNGNHNGDNNRGAVNGNVNGNGNRGFGNGNLNGGANTGFGNGNRNGNRNTGRFGGDHNGNHNANVASGSVGPARARTEHVSVRTGAIGLHETFHRSATGRITGHFSFRDGPFAARGIFAHRGSVWSFAFHLSNIPGIARMVIRDGAVTRANFDGCLDCGGVGNVGALEGLGNASTTSGNYNVGVLNGDFNGSRFNGNLNVGILNGDFNGRGYSPFGTNGTYNGNGNTGTVNGNFNGRAPAVAAMARSVMAATRDRLGAAPENSSPAVLPTLPQ